MYTLREHGTQAGFGAIGSNVDLLPALRYLSKPRITKEMIMVKIEFETTNAAFEQAPAWESARILRQIAEWLENGERLGGGPIFDVNGNRIGHWEMTPHSMR